MVDITLVESTMCDEEMLKQSDQKEEVLSNVSNTEETRSG